MNNAEVQRLPLRKHYLRGQDNKVINLDKRHCGFSVIGNFEDLTVKL